MSAGLRVMVVLLSLGLGGCSVLEFVYNRADRFALREIERYLDLQPAQRDATAAALAALHAEHRREQLPVIATDLRTFAEALAVPLSAADWEVWVRRLETRINDSLAPLPARAAPLIALLEDAQLEAFWRRLAEAREERRAEREARSPGERAKAVERSLRRWIGRLRPEQRSAVRRWAEARGEGVEDAAYAAYLAERERALRALLERRRAPDFAERLQAFIEDDRVPASSRARWQAEREAFLGLLADLSAGLTPAQRERGQSRLRAYAEQVETLAAAAT